MPEKHCPILIPLYHSGEANWDETGCLEEDCAWWNEDFQCCGLVVQGVIWGLEAARSAQRWQAFVDNDYPYGSNERVEGE